jgi:photosystem II stability/assembly factor-like uncharacterized protein
MMLLSALPHLAHYGDPNKHGCMSDEQAVQITGIAGNLCVPPCDGSGACPTDVPSGVTAKPDCALSSSAGGKYCALVCTPSGNDDQCGADASCKLAGLTQMAAGEGLCTYDDMPLPPSSAHWAPVNSPTFDALGEAIAVGFDKTGQVGWVGAGSNGVGAQVMKSVDAGVTWNAVYPAGGKPGANLYLASVVKDKQDAVVSGAFAQVYTTDGTNFNASTNARLSPGQDAGVTPGGKYALVAMDGLQNTNGVLLSDDGKTWSFSADIGLNATQYGARYGSFPSDTTWYVTAGTWPEELSARQGTRRPLNKHAAMTGAQMQLNLDAPPRNDDTGYYAAVLKTTDGGQSWTTVYQKENQGIYPNGIHCSSETHCVAVLEGETARIIVTRDGGKTWSESMHDTDPASSLMYVHMINEKEGWAAGGHMEQLSFEGRYFHTLDGGDTWTKEAIKGLYIVSLDMVTATSGFSVALTLQSGVQLMKYQQPNSSLLTTTWAPRKKEDQCDKSPCDPTAGDCKGGCSCEAVGLRMYQCL